MNRTNPADFKKVGGAVDGVVLGYQKRWLEDKSKVKLIEKSRRVGISWAEAGDDALYAASESGDDVWYIGYNKDMAAEFISDAGEWAKFYQLAATELEETLFEDDDPDKKILAYVIKFKSGHRITALSSRPTNLRGKQGRCVIDEAAFHDDLPGLLKAALAFLMWGGDVRIISTHFGESNEFNSLVQDTRAGRKPYSLHRVAFDDAIKDGLCKRIFHVLGRKWSSGAEKEWVAEMRAYYGSDVEEELDCIPSQGAGAFLSRTLIETCLSADLPVIRYGQKDDFAVKPDGYRQEVIHEWCEEVLTPLLSRLDKKRRHYFGEDFGRTGDLTVITPLAEKQDAAFYAPFVLELRNIPFQQQEQILCHIVDRLPKFTYGALDARGNGQYLAERAMQRYGKHRIAQVMLSESWYRENMPAYKAAFEDRSILLPKDADIIEDHRAFKMIRGVAKLPELRTSGADKGQRHGDSGVAGALSWFSTRQETTSMPEVLTAGRRPGVRDMDAYYESVEMEMY